MKDHHRRANNTRNAPTGWYGTGEEMLGVEACFCPILPLINQLYMLGEDNGAEAVLGATKSGAGSSGRN